MLRAADDHAVLHAHDLGRFTQHDLDLAGVLVPGLCPRHRLGPWLDLRKAHDAAFRLGDHLLGDDEHVTLGRRHSRGLTAGTTLLGNWVITLAPIFSGLAWSIIFGILTSTLFTLLVIPIVYWQLYGEGHRRATLTET